MSRDSESRIIDHPRTDLKRISFSFAAGDFHLEPVVLIEYLRQDCEIIHPRFRRAVLRYIHVWRIGVGISSVALKCVIFKILCVSGQHRDGRLRFLFFPERLHRSNGKTA